MPGRCKVLGGDRFPGRGDESNYPAGASFLRFYHGGMTKELFHGRYGTKFAFNSVQLQLE